MEALLASDIEDTVFFYNSNIHPQCEYDLRKEENTRFAKKHGVPVVEADYDKDEWPHPRREWSGNPSGGHAVSCASTCAVTAQPSMPMKTASA